MAWINLKDLEGNAQLGMIADYSMVRFSDSSHAQKAVRWAFYRYSPEITIVDDNLDAGAAKAAGFSGDDLFMALVQYKEEGQQARVHPSLLAVAIDVIQAMGGSDFRRWLVGREHLANCYTEVLSPMVETDEDKRAGVLLKRGELFQKVNDIEASINKLGEQLFKKDDGDNIENLARFVMPEGTAKSAYGSEGEENDD